MTANLQRALHLLEDGYPRVQWAGGGSPQGTGPWSFRGDDGSGGGDGSGGDSGVGGAVVMAVEVTAASAAVAAQMGCYG